MLAPPEADDGFHDGSENPRCWADAKAKGRVAVHLAPPAKAHVLAVCLVHHHVVVCVTDVNHPPANTVFQDLASFAVMV
eukprot:2415047-Rhodomonas_salina.1